MVGLICLAKALLSGYIAGKSYNAIHHHNRAEKLRGTAIEDIYHQEAGAFVSRGSFGQYYAHCSGALLSDRVFVTAAHCSWGSGRESDYQVNVSIEPFIDRYVNTTLMHGTLHVNPQLDLAVIVLDRSIFWTPEWQANGASSAEVMRMSATYALLPQINQLANDRTYFTLVGYGITDPKQDANYYANTRRFGFADYKSRSDRTLTTGSSVVACGDDSGGAVYYRNTHILAGIVSAADDDCKKETIVVRLDTAEALSFLAPFLERP